MSKRKREESDKDVGKPTKKLKVDDESEKFNTWEEMCVEILNISPRETIHYKKVKEEIEKKFFDGDEKRIVEFSGKRCPFGHTLNALSNNPEIFDKVEPGYYRLVSSENWKEALEVVVKRKIAWREKKKKE